ncbi:MAG: hypothetical protein ACUVS2_05655 [Candidatus Flexifilum sp.]
MTIDLQPIREALKAGDKARARQLLTPILTSQPSADAWALAARACDTDEAAIKCLRKALALDPFHGEANRLLLRIEGAVPPEALRREREERIAAFATGELLQQMLKPEANPLVTEKRPRRAHKPASPWRAVGCLGFILLGLSVGLLTLNLIGIVSGVFGTIARATGGPTPVMEWQGVPLSAVENAAYVLPAAQSEPALVRDADVLDDGYVHEYTFAGTAGQEVAVYVQFLSLGADRVSRNVAILRPDGSDGRGSCTRDQIIQGDNNIVYICTLNQSGTWRVRILGRAGESVGAYFVGVEEFTGG